MGAESPEFPVEPSQLPQIPIQSLADLPDEIYPWSVILARAACPFWLTSAGTAHMLLVSEQVPEQIMTGANGLGSQGRASTAADSRREDHVGSDASSVS